MTTQKLLAKLFKYNKTQATFFQGNSRELHSRGTVAALPAGKTLRLPPQFF